MIGADDIDAFFDPDEFGCTAQLIEPGREPRSVDGMIGAPQKSQPLYRSGRDFNAANIKGKPRQMILQIPTRDLPENWSKTLVVLDGISYSIAEAEPIGRLRTALTLTPPVDRASAGAQDSWRASPSI